MAALVNREILAAEPVVTDVMDVESAKKTGAMALFGEKYGDSVRVVKMGDFSKELCGGTHVANTGNIGLFTVLSETSVAAGVRRIEGTTGPGVLARLREEEALLNGCAASLKVQTPADIPHRLEQMHAETKELKRELEKAQTALARAEVAAMLGEAVSCGKVRLRAKRLDTTPDAAR